MPLATAHTSVSAHSTAISVPAQFARSDATTSPRTSRAKLVVIPHDGHGLPVSTTKLHGGMPSCVCVAIVRGVPSASYGFSQNATANTPASSRGDHQQRQPRDPSPRSRGVSPSGAPAGRRRSLGRRSCRGSRAARIASARNATQADFHSFWTIRDDIQQHCTANGGSRGDAVCCGEVRRFVASRRSAASRASSRSPAARTGRAACARCTRRGPAADGRARQPPAPRRGIGRGRSLRARTVRVARACECRVKVGRCRGARGRDNLESTARRVRYEFFAEVATEVGAAWIATGHTADDQAETVLHRLIRGTGIQGLRGIARPTPPLPAGGGRQPP